MKRIGNFSWQARPRGGGGVALLVFMAIALVVLLPLVLIGVVIALAAAGVRALTGAARQVFATGAGMRAEPRLGDDEGRKNVRVRRVEHHAVDGRGEGEM